MKKLSLRQLIGLSASLFILLFQREAYGLSEEGIGLAEEVEFQTFRQKRIIEAWREMLTDPQFIKGVHKEAKDQQKKVLGNESVQIFREAKTAWKLAQKTDNQEIKDAANNYLQEKSLFPFCQAYYRYREKPQILKKLDAKIEKDFKNPYMCDLLRELAAEGCGAPLSTWAALKYFSNGLGINLSVVIPQVLGESLSSALAQNEPYLKAAIFKEQLSMFNSSKEEAASKESDPHEDEKEKKNTIIKKEWGFDKDTFSKNEPFLIGWQEIREYSNKISSTKETIHVDYEKELKEFKSFLESDQLCKNLKILTEEECSQLHQEKIKEFLSTKDSGLRKKTFKALALVFHPDRKGKESLFKALSHLNGFLIKVSELDPFIKQYNTRRVNLNRYYDLVFSTTLRSTFQTVFSLTLRTQGEFLDFLTGEETASFSLLNDQPKEKVQKELATFLGNGTGFLIWNQFTKSSWGKEMKLSPDLSDSYIKQNHFPSHFGELGKDVLMGFGLNGMFSLFQRGLEEILLFFV